MKKNYHTTARTRLMRLGLFALLFFTCSTGFSQLLPGASMEDSTAWHVYNLGSAFPASYKFNYTAQVPAKGKNGCLHVTSTQKTGILFWQKLTLKAGKYYEVDGAVKINNVASFWCELYLSTVVPLENVDYSPNGNGDVVLGFSTWVGCGPYIDGTFATKACSGKRLYKVPGNYGADVDVYFALKTGSIAEPLPAPLDVLIDELRVTLVNDDVLLSTKEGRIDSVNTRVVHVSPFIRVEDFRGGLHAAPTARLDVVDLVSNATILHQDTTVIAETMGVQVRGTNDTTVYPIKLRTISIKNGIQSVSLGAVDHHHLKLKFLPANARVIQLKSGLKVSRQATFKVVDANNVEAANLAFLSRQLKVVVTAENGTTKTYKLDVNGRLLHTHTHTNYVDTVKSIRNKIVVINGSSTVAITKKQNPLEGTVLNLTSTDVWLYFPTIKPSTFVEKYLAQVMVNNQAAVVDQNIRLEQYLQGTMLISQPIDYKPLELFSGENLSGASLHVGNYTYTKVQELGSMNDSARSFLLKKGYMATLAKDELGTGYSRVYIADKNDIIINKLPAGLYKDVSFVRVIPWRWVAKKGWTSDPNSAEALNCSWQYDWNNEATSQPNVEYIPMRHGRYWNAFENINTKKKSTHALGFNEPERADQSNMTVGDAIALWPELLKSGLRLGSPAPSDGGLEWLYQFIDRCDALNYRVDFVAVHWYMGGQSPRQFYDRLKGIHNRTKRPIWITEWNNGANWTCCKPTYPLQAAAIRDFLTMLDTASFVERYSLYEWVEDTRQMFFKSPKLLTPAGEVYRDKVSPMAYNEAMAFSHDYVVPPATPIEYAGVGVGFDNGKSLSVDFDNDGDLDIVYSGVDPYVGGILRNDGHGNFTSTNQPLQGLFTPSIQAGDIEGDGDLDVILSGWDRQHNWVAYSKILLNDGTGIFTPQTPPSINAPAAGFADLDNNGLLDYFMIGNGNTNKFYFQKAAGFDAPVNRVNNANNIQDPDASWVDIDNDQDVDFCVEAWNRSNGRRYTQVWKNNGKGVFKEQTIPFKQKHWGSSQFADIDHDGDMDMLLNGDGDANSDAGSSDIYRLYINNGTGGYTEGATFQNYRQNTNGKGSSFVDWDNDGDYDIILTGYSSTEGKEVVNIYLNNGNGVFSKSAESLNIPGLNRGTIELGDFNNDGKIDALLNGYSGGAFARNVAFLFKNTTSLVNNAPTPPNTLHTTVAGDSVLFTWTKGADAETHANSLTYNLYVKDSTGKYYVFANANTSTGRVMKVGHGNAYLNLGWKLRALPAGTYRWSVQSIDASYSGSMFANEATFTIGGTVQNARKATGDKGESLVNDGASENYLYPNPAENVLTVPRATHASTVLIYSTTGTLMQASELGRDNTLSVKELPTGIYMVKFNSNGTTVTSKLVKK